MAYSPISLLVPQFETSAGVPYSGAVLKAYAAGTSTNISMATNSGGGTTFTSIALNSNGFPEHSGSIVIPHVNVNYKIALYATQAAADANSGAIWSIDNLVPVAVSGSFSTDDATSSGVTNVVTITHTTSGTPVAGIGTGLAFVTETANGNNETGLVIGSEATDVTAASEDFEWFVSLMAAGAAVAKKLRLSSLGRLFGFTSFDLARATVASHATTGDIWSNGNQIDWTGTATTTAFPAAPQAGAERVLICAGACAFTAGANMLIDGVSSGNTVTCAANDQVVVRAVTTSQFKLTRIKYDGSSQVWAGGAALATAELPTGANIASASTINLDTATGNRIHVTGSTTITAVTLTKGPRTVIFDGALTLTHHTTNNNLPSAANITTVSGDRAIYESDGTTVYCVAYIRASGTAVVAGAVGDHEVVVTTGNGHGSTNTKIRRYTTTQSSVGSAITYADSAGNGASFTINTAGLYAIRMTDRSMTFGISLNSAELTTDVNSITAANRLVAVTSNATDNDVTEAFAVVSLAASDVIRPHTTVGTPSESAYNNTFSIRRIGAV